MTRIVDGDTLWLDGQRARLIGIDAPELEPDPQCYAEEATRRLAELAPVGSTVTLAFEADRRDGFGRLLVHLFRDGTHINLTMVRAGAATVLLVGRNTRYAAELYAAEDAARAAGAGLWSACYPPAPDLGVHIAAVRADGPGDDLAWEDSEYVELVGSGGAAVDVGGWTLRDAADHRIVIPEGYAIPPQGRLRVYSGPGRSTPDRYFADLDQPVWNNGGDTVWLLDRDGRLVDLYRY